MIAALSTLIATLGVAGAEIVLGGTVRAAPAIFFFGGVGTALTIANARRAAWVATRAPGADATEVLVRALRTDRRVASALLMQLPKVLRERQGPVLATLDAAIAHAESIGARDVAAVRSIASAGHSVRTALEVGGDATAATATATLRGMLTPAR